MPLFVFNAGYDPIALTVDLAGLPVAVLVRIRADRVFYTDPAARAPGQMGRPRRHGARFCCADPASWPTPQQTLQVDDDQYGRVVVTAWAGLHPKLVGRGRWTDCPAPPIVAGTVIRVQVEHLPGPRGRAVKTLWLWWAGLGTPDLDLCWRAYIRRFDGEPGGGGPVEGDRLSQLAAEVKASGGTVFFVDEVGVRSDYHAGTTWAPIAQTPTVAATGARFG